MAVASVPALADGECGPVPVAPAIPAASDLAGKTPDASRAEVLDAYHQVKNYQSTLKPYRACLSTQQDAQKAALADAQSKKDKDKAAAAQQAYADLAKLYDNTVDTETQVASEFNALHTADCVTDTDPKICPKK
jgi:hypothetical protein